MNEKIISYINEELRERNWSQRELARRTGLSQTTISSILAGHRNISFDVCAAVAKVFNESPERLFRLAGLLPPLPGPTIDKMIDEASEIMARLPRDRREEILEFARWQLERFHADRSRNYQNDPPGVDDLANGALA